MEATEDTSDAGAGLDSGSVEDVLPVALTPLAAIALVFFAAGAVLMLEILAVRLLAPYVGLTLTTTTSIIGAALAGIAIGAAGGGYFADRTQTRTLIVGLLASGGLLTLLIVPTVRWLGPSVRGGGDFAALGITVVTLVPAAIVLSAISPAVLDVSSSVSCFGAASDIIIRYIIIIMFASPPPPLATPCSCTETTLPSFAPDTSASRVALALASSIAF